MSRRNHDYRVKAKCRVCGRTWITRPKPNSDAPHRCHKTAKGEGCGSTKVERKQLYIKSTAPEDPDWIKVEE